MAPFRALAVVVLGVAIVGGGKRLLDGNMHDADAQTNHFVGGGNPDARLRHADNLSMTVDAGNMALPMPSGAAVKGEAFPRGVSANGVLTVDIATGGRLPEYISAQVAASFYDDLGEMMEELDATAWTAVGGGPLASFIFNINFAVNAGLLFCFTRYIDLSGVDSVVGWSNWRQGEASPILDDDRMVVAFEASAEPRFSRRWRFSFHSSQAGLWQHLKIELSGYSLLNVTRDMNVFRSRPILTNKLPVSVDAGNGSMPALSGLALEGEALPREVSVSGLPMDTINASDSENMFTRAAHFIDTADAFMALLNATVWTAAGRGRDSIVSLLFTIQFAVTEGRLFCFCRYRARSAVGSEGGWSHWRQAEARLNMFSPGWQIEFKASADPRLMDLASQSVEYRPWFSAGWSFSFLGYHYQPLQELEIRLFGSPLRSAAGINLELQELFTNDLPISVGAGNGALPVRSGAAVGGEALPRGVSADCVHKVKLATQGRLLEDTVTRIAAAVNDRTGAQMAELDGTMWSATGLGPRKSLMFKVSFAVNAGRFFCFTRFIERSKRSGWWRWSDWRQAEARPVFDASGTAIAFEASAEPNSSPGWRFQVSPRSSALLRLEISLFGYPLDHVTRLS